MSSSSHRDLILDQFSRQAVPVSAAPGLKDEQALRLIVESTGAGPEATVLDVAFGGVRGGAGAYQRELEAGRRPAAAVPRRRLCAIPSRFWWPTSPPPRNRAKGQCGYRA